ncbi:hypothetical protein [Geitlerinema sp. PCC 9228]|jgi:hypothetical protein|uniref:hypothetical protein n=1 Tax=Geitlerinema sp. PCC 9228 TaxID=111611 RepID=UPI0008F9B22F|nr:hypothetical protein [Geitlerinema sp. PCC 9228]
MSKITYPNAPDVSPDDYLVLGVASYFAQQGDQTLEVKTLEPIPSGYVEALVAGAETAYQYIWAATLKEVLLGEMPQMPAHLDGEVQFGYDFTARAIAAVRTYKSRPEAKLHLPPGQSWSKLNHGYQPTTHE